MIHGVLLVNKTAGVTSHDVVRVLRGMLAQKAVGHAGTLDPMAEGLMVILLGQGTKLSSYLLVNDKRYRFTLRLGLTTDTLDKTGEVVNKTKVRLDERDIREVLEKGCGSLLLPVPLVSAVKIKGKKLYQYKRENRPVTPPVRSMCFYDLTVRDVQSETAQVELSCKKGAYVRSWVAFVGEKLGVGACLEELTRLRSTPFELENALTVKEIEQKIKTVGLQDPLQSLTPAFVPFSQALSHIPAVRAGRGDESSLRQGQVPGDVKALLIGEQKTVNKNNKPQVVRVMSYNNERMLALMELKPFLSPRFLRVFQA